MKKLRFLWNCSTLLYNDLLSDCLPLIKLVVEKLPFGSLPCLLEFGQFSCLYILFLGFTLLVIALRKALLLTDCNWNDFFGQKRQHLQYSEKKLWNLVDTVKGETLSWIYLVQYLKSLRIIDLWLPLNNAFSYFGEFIIISTRTI